MALTCNIDSRGKKARFIYGLVMLLLGIVLTITLALPTGSVWFWAISIACVLGGAFAIFEARAGWCVVRAMGFKTKM